MKTFSKDISLRLICIILLSSATTVVENSFVSSESKVRVDIKWPAKTPGMELSDEAFDDLLLMTSADKEKYQCILPNTNPEDEIAQNTKDGYKGQSPLQLLKPLFSKLLCYFRIESFWSYELCHGYYFRQFHDETNANGRVLHEFYLGNFDPSAASREENTNIENSSLTHTGPLPTIRVEDAELPYFALNMTDGTFCTLTEQNRFTRVLYVCHPKGNNGIYSIKETSSCEYEVIVLTTLLCKHPAFRFNYFTENVVSCYPLPGYPPEPLGLKKLKEEALNPDTFQPIIGSAEPYTITKQAEKPVSKSEQHKDNPPTHPHDQKLIDDVLSGEYCLHGQGTSWWMYEFCYGKLVQQYHENQGGSKTVILLGTWNVEKHMLWLEKHPYKKPKSGEITKQISHLYTDGSFCDEAQKHRQVEVRLKCKDISGHPDAVSLYLMEPHICEYILTVESPIFCSLLLSLDENGLTSNLMKK